MIIARFILKKAANSSNGLIPALDGGRIVFVLLEGVRRGKRISPKREGLIHAIGFALLMAAFLAITYQDIIRIISGDSLIP